MVASLLMRLVMRALQANKRRASPTRKSDRLDLPARARDNCVTRSQMCNPPGDRMASFRGHILNAAIRYAGKRRLADLEFTPAAIAASRARMDRLGDRVPLAASLTRHTCARHC